MRRFTLNPSILVATVVYRCHTQYQKWTHISLQSCNNTVTHFCCGHLPRQPNGCCHRGWGWAAMRPPLTLVCISSTLQIRRKIRLRGPGRQLSLRRQFYLGMRATSQKKKTQCHAISQKTQGKKKKSNQCKARVASPCYQEVAICRQCRIRKCKKQPFEKIAEVER